MLAAYEPQRHSTVYIRVFLKRHFVKNQKAHHTTQQRDTQGEHIQKEGINKQVVGVGT